MLIELQNKLRTLTVPGEEIVCAVSGGADSMALLWGLYLSKEKLGIRLSAAHFDHNLRGGESRQDADFVREFCQRYEIPLMLGSGQIVTGKKGLEAAARDARYAFLDTLPGKIATAHTADDNAETVLMHLIRGTGLKGLGGIAPVNGRLIRPMLGITRQQVEEFLTQWSIPHREDSSNAGDDFLRNRLRHHVMPLLKQENPRLAENLSAMALRLRQDEAALSEMAELEAMPDVEKLKKMHPAIRSRMLGSFLKQQGVREPEAQHIAMLEALIFSDKPSARAEFPGGVTLCRSYQHLTVAEDTKPLGRVILSKNGEWALPELGIKVITEPAKTLDSTAASFVVSPVGDLVMRCRQEGDRIRLSGGTKTLKKLWIDKKIPAQKRLQIPVFGDENGVLAVYGIGVNLDRMPEELPAIRITIQPL